MNQQAGGIVLYSAVLRPHRSAGSHGVRVVIGLMAVAWLVMGVAFAAAGAWPVTPFLGLEGVLLYGAFRLNNRAGNSLEAINLTEAALTVRRVDFWGKQSHFSFPPYWLQVNYDEPPTPHSLLELRSHGSSLIIGGFLAPDERLELAVSLRTELMRLTRSRRPG